MIQNRSKTKVFRARLGESIYSLSNEFHLTDPNIHMMQPSYNMLHDVHTRKYFQRKDVRSRLQKDDFITEDNEVTCTLKEYRLHQMYLETLKRASDQTMNEIQRDQLRKFLMCQEEGRVPSDVTLSEMREILLEEEVQGLRQQLQANSDWGKMTKRLPEREQEYFKEMNLLNWKAEERARLRRIENEVRHEWNRERLLKEAQERRTQKKIAMLVRKSANQNKKLLENIKTSEDVAKQELIKNKPTQQKAVGEPSATEITQAAASPVAKPRKQWAYRSGNN
ncbi:fibrous sheath-interacting protein 2-like [Conger conger]|uniref:fibrous sheath-interacting protein 2-like n=1 Tax=Conger conger TaxID=82655 RepID=UPI002A59A010|nr:fibrous sheath-interacting protein 2-like [Conger conger]